MEFIDEQDDVIISCDFLDGLFKAVFEFSTELRASDHARQIKGVDALSKKRLRHFIIGDFQRKSFNHSTFASSCLTTEDGTTATLFRQNIGDSHNFVLTPDKRVDFAVTSHLRQIDGVFGKVLSATVAIGVATAVTVVADVFQHVFLKDAVL